MTEMIDKHSDTWILIDRFIRARLKDLGEQVETIGLGPDSTNAIRGKISLAREILGLPDIKEIEITTDDERELY